MSFQVLFFHNLSYRVWRLRTVRVSFERKWPKLSKIKNGEKNSPFFGPNLWLRDSQFWVIIFINGRLIGNKKLDSIENVWVIIIIIIIRGVKRKKRDYLVQLWGKATTFSFQKNKPNQNGGMQCCAKPIHPDKSYVSTSKQESLTWTHASVLRRSSMSLQMTREMNWKMNGHRNTKGASLQTCKQTLSSSKKKHNFIQHLSNWSSSILFFVFRLPSTSPRPISTQVKIR